MLTSSLSSAMRHQARVISTATFLHLEAPCGSVSDLTISLFKSTILIGIQQIPHWGVRHTSPNLVVKTTSQLSQRSQTTKTVNEKPRRTCREHIVSSSPPGVLPTSLNTPRALEILYQQGTSKVHDTRRERCPVRVAVGPRGNRTPMSLFWTASKSYQQPYHLHPPPFRPAVRGDYPTPCNTCR
jgi:hypothetical protein